MQKPHSSVLRKRIYPVSIRMHSKPTQRKLASYKKTSRGEVSRRSLATIAKNNNLETKKKRSVVRKRLQLIAVITPAIINHLFSYGAVCSCPSFVYNKSVTTQSVAKQELSKYKAEQPPTYQIHSLKRDINKKLFGKADTIIDKILSCSRNKLSNSQNKNFGWCWYWSVDLRLYSTFASKKLKRSRHLLYFTRRCWNIILSSV